MAKGLNIFKRATPPAGQKLFKRSSAPPSVVTVLDLDGATLRVAQTSNRTTLNLVAAVALDLAPDADRSDPALVGASVGRALAKLGIKASSVVMGVGRARVVLRDLRLPVVQKLSDLAALVHFQVTKDLPFPAEEAIIDFKVGRELQVPKERTEMPAKPDATAEAPTAVTKVEVLVAAVKRDVVEFHEKLAAAAGIKLAALGLLPYANSRCMEACRVAVDGQAMALLTLRPDEVSLEVMSQQSLLFSRGSVMRAIGETPHVDGAVPVTTEAFVQAATIEAVRSLHGYGAAEPNLPVAKILVVGATGCEDAVVQALSAKMAAPCATLDPAAALQLAPEKREDAAGSVGVIGLALGFGDEEGLPFDFLNPKQPSKPRNTKRLVILAGLAGLAVLVIGLMATRKMLIDRRTSILNAAAVELEDAEKKRPIYKALMGRATVVGDWVKGGRDWLQHYAYLSSVLPPTEEAYLTAFSVDNQGIIRLAVQARSGQILAALDSKLRAAGYEIKPLAITPGANRFGYEFRSNVELTPSPKLKIDLAKLKPVVRPADDASLDPKAWRQGNR